METSKVLEINASLWNLVEGKDVKESAKVIISYAALLPPSNRYVMEGSSRMNHHERYTGQTDQGNFSFEEEKEKSKEFSYGLNKERIGHFRLWRVNNLIFFHHFWASALETSVDETYVKIYGISYDVENLELDGFGRVRKFTTWKLTLFNLELKLLKTYLVSVIPESKIYKLGTEISIMLRQK